MGKFRIKISPTWFSSDYVIFKYSTNGIFWKTIKEYTYNSLHEWCYMETMTTSFHNAEFVLNNFKTLEDVIKFEAEERILVNNKNKEFAEKTKRKEEEKSNIYKKYS